jgi:tRNA pseudouridine38-40 synthase
LLAARDRTRAAPTFAPDGLYLTGIDYPPRWNLPSTHAPIRAFGT